MPEKFMDDTPIEEHLFGGKLITGRKGFLAGKENYVDMRNMRYSAGGIGVETRLGMRRFNNTAVASGGDLEKIWQHLYNFEQTQYQDVYVVSDEKKLYKADAIPESGAGAGSLGSSLFSFTANSDIPSFCSVGTHAIVSSTKDIAAYSGASPYCAAFLYGTDIGNNDDGTDEDDVTFQIATDLVTNDKSTRTVAITLDTQANGEALYVGYWQPIDGITFDLTAGGQRNGGTLSVEYWNGAAWTGLTVTDGTKASGWPFYQDGSITWTYVSEYTEKPRRINGQTLFWYRITSDSTLQSCTFAKITVLKDWRRIEDLTDGMDLYPTGFLWLDDDGGDDTVHDLLDKVLVDSKGTYASFTDSAADTDISDSDILYIGFAQPVIGIKIWIVEDYNADKVSSTMTVAYWSGTSFTNYDADGKYDGTSSNSKSFNQSGEIRLEQIGQSETPTTIKGAGIKLPMFWYKLSFSADLCNDSNDELRIWKIRGVPAPLQQHQINLCNWVESFKDRLWRFGPEDAPNTGEFSAYKNPFALSGEDTSRSWPRVVFGDGDAVTCAVNFFNECIVFKRNEVWMMEGDSPENFGTLLLDDTLGCVAPQTAKLVRTWVTLPDGRRDFRHAVFFMAQDGIWGCDGLKNWKISEDIENYFNPKETGTCIKSGYRQLSSAFFDPIENEYHVFIWSGSTPTLLEFIYNTELSRWGGPFVRLTDCECGESVLDSNNDRLSYGGGTDGRMYRLEISSNDVYTNGTAGAIDNYIEMADHWTGLLAKFAHRGVFLYGEAQSAGNVTVTMKGDAADNAVTLGTISMIRSGYSTFIGRVNIGGYDSSGSEMENKFHSIRIKLATNTAGVRQELFGFLLKKEHVSEAATV